MVIRDRMEIGKLRSIKDNIIKGHPNNLNRGKGNQNNLNSNKDSHHNKDNHHNKDSLHSKDNLNKLVNPKVLLVLVSYPSSQEEEKTTS